MTSLLYGLAMLGALVLGIGGLWMWRRDRTRALLLLAASAVTLLNLVSWSTLPAPSRQGVAPPASG